MTLLCSVLYVSLVPEPVYLLSSDYQMNQRPFREAMECNSLCSRLPPIDIQDRCCGRPARNLQSLKSSPEKIKRKNTFRVRKLYKTLKSLFSIISLSVHHTGYYKGQQSVGILFFIVMFIMKESTATCRVNSYSPVECVLANLAKE